MSYRTLKLLNLLELPCIALGCVATAACALALVLL